jgi:hypothetical protein
METPLQRDAGLTVGRTFDEPAQGALTITPADVDLSVPVRGLYVGTGGNVAATMLNGDTATFINVPGGSILPLMVKRVAAATTASDIIGLK